MADEVQQIFTLDGPPATNIAAWRAAPPAFLTGHGFKLVDESYESLVFEADVTSRFVRVAMFGMATTLYRLSITFRDSPDSPGATRMTITGQAPEQAREELLALAGGRS